MRRERVGRVSRTAIGLALDPGKKAAAPRGAPGRAPHAAPRSRTGQNSEIRSPTVAKTSCCISFSLSDASWNQLK